MTLSSPWQLDPRLAEGTLPVGNLPLCRVLLKDDRTVPWLILVPVVPGATELLDLTYPARARLVEEVALASRALSRLHHPDKINLGSLGNVVPQLHLHVVARFRADRAWPGPIWGAPGGQRFAPGEGAAEAGRVAKALGLERPR